MNGLREALAGYLDLRHSLGFKLEREAMLLKQFIAYLHERGSRTVTVTGACHDNCVSHGWTKIGRRDWHSVGRGTICESGYQHRRL